MNNNIALRDTNIMMQRRSALMRQMTLSVAAPLIIAMNFSGCGGGGAQQNSESASLPPAVAQAQQADTPVDPGIVAADNAFGLNLLKTLNQGSTVNVAISPISIALALQIVYNGANGSTQLAMSQTLQLNNSTAQDVDIENAALEASLIDSDPQVQLVVANSLWMHLSDNSVLPTFIQANQTYYGAEIGDLSGAPANVNAWVSSKTNGLITQILPAGNYADVVAVIANAIYFKGAWTIPFDPAQTSTAPFTLSDGNQIVCNMMHQTGNYAYFRGENFQAIRIPYGQNRMSMFIVLPDSGVNLNTFVADISADALSTWVSKLQSSYGVIELPRFASTYGASLKTALSSLGMSIAFDGNNADFSGIAPRAYIAAVAHKTVVKVDESGTVAAGATQITIGTIAVQAPQYIMVMDHPFFYAIRDDKTGALLFIGTLADPS